MKLVDADKIYNFVSNEKERTETTDALKEILQNTPNVLEEFVKSKCYEVMALYDAYMYARNDFFTCADKLREGLFWMDDIDHKSRNMQNAYARYRDLRHSVSQFAHVTGNEKLFDEMVGELNIVPEKCEPKEKK